MKKLLTILSLFLTAFSTLSVMPPGWYQQTLPVNDFVNDIYFVDTLNGWIVTEGHTANNDTAYIMKTTNGGNNWNIQFARNIQLNVVQFVNLQTGYVGGGLPGATYMFKTTNGGTNWFEVISSASAGTEVDDMHFINADTGWYCDNSTLDGGLYKTTNGGGSWVQQLNNDYQPIKIFFINKDTGWMIENDQVYQTNNGGTNWILKSGLGFSLRDIWFVNSNTGWVIKSGVNGIYRTTNGGSNWQQQTDPDPLGSGLVEIFFVNPTTGYIATGFSKIIKTTDGLTWGRQEAPNAGGYNNIFFTDPAHGWAGGGNTLIHTTDSGGPVTGISQINSGVPQSFKLEQNYPNPFNPKTIINYQCSMTNMVELKVYDITGKIIAVLVNERQTPGTYQYIFDGSNISSGVYFYTLQTENFTETKKMLLLK